MSLVYDVFDFVKTNPGVDGMKIQNYFSNNVVSDSLADLETRDAIRWTKQGYYVLTEQLEEMKLSLEDSLDQIEKYLKENKSTKCPNCTKKAYGKVEIESLFGFRNDKGNIIPQSYCRPCRSNHIPKTSYNSKYAHDPLECTTNFVSAKVAKTMQNNINIEGVVIQKEIKKEFDYIDGHYRSFCTAYLIDDSDDVVKIVLWGDDVSRVKNGSRIKILRGYTRTYDGETSVNIRTAGLLEVISYSERQKSKKLFSFKPKTEPDVFSFENCIIASSDDILKVDFTDNFEQKRDDLKF